MHSQHVVEYDQLSIRVFSALAGNALNNISSSAGKMLDVACAFFDKDVSNTLTEFQSLYFEDSGLNDHATIMNQHVDDMFNAAKAAKDSDSIAFSPEQENSLKLANLQKELEALIQQDDHIKSRMVPVMQCMQYEDLISNRIKRLIKCWDYVIRLFDDDKRSVEEAVNVLNNILASEEENRLFYKLVLKTDNYTQDVVNVWKNIDDIDVLEKRFFEFSQASLDACIEETQKAFDELIKLLKLLTGESKDVSYLFSGTQEKMNDVKNIIDSHPTDSHKDARKLIKALESSYSKQSSDINGLIQSFMVALQSQDTIRQNIENIGRFHTQWVQNRKKVQSSHEFDESQKLTFGNALLLDMTTQEERIIIQSCMPDVALNVEDANQNNELF